MNILIALLPSIIWGVMPILVNKIGGKPIQQSIGTAGGCFIFGTIIYLLVRPEMSQTLIIGCILSGLAWSVGQLMQYKSYVMLGTSKAFALSISFEMILNSLVAVLIFHEWVTPFQLILGFSSIAIVIVGGIMTSYSDQKEKSTDYKRGVLVVLCAAIGFVLWNSAIKYVNADGLPAVLPQSVGMLAGTLVLGFISERSVKKFDKTTLRLLFTGLFYSLANFSLIYSNKLNGVAIAYTLAQLCLVVETILGITVLHEQKSKAELRHSILGVAFITLGCIMVGFTSM